MNNSFSSTNYKDSRQKAQLRLSNFRKVYLWLIALLLCLFSTCLPLASAQETSDENQVNMPGLSLDDYGIAIGGQYRAMASFTNFDFHPQSISNDQSALSVLNQRLRTWVNFHDREDSDHGAYLQVEIGHTNWGDDGDFPKTHGANGSEVGIELRRGYLWYKPTSNTLFRAGVLDWHDRFGERPSFDDPMWAVDQYDSFKAVLANSIWDFNVGGVTFDGTLEDKWHYGLGAMVLEKSGRTLTGDGSALLYTADLDREIGSALLGGSVYYLKDNGDYSYGEFGGPMDSYDSSWDLWTGFRGHFQIGRVAPSFFLILNTGETNNTDWEHTGWAGKGALDFDTGFGKLSLQALYSSGNDGTSESDSGEFRTIAQSVRDDFGAQGYWSGLGLSSPRGPSDVVDLGVGLQNRGLGLRTVQLGFEKEVSTKTSMYLATGYLQSDEENPVNGEKNIGVELLGELHWVLKKSMGVDLGASYLFTGNFYKSASDALDPDNLYQIYLRYQLEF